MSFGGATSGICPGCGARCVSLGNHARYSKTCTREARFWGQVDRRTQAECWLWQGRKDKSGYGRYDRKGVYVYPHRVAWLFTHGAIPSEMEVAHHCDVRNCCNPSHLFLATHEENMLDCKNKRRHVHGERSHHAKLTHAQVLEIRRDYKYEKAKKGVRRIYRSNAFALAQKYGVSSVVVTNAALRHTYKNLP